MSWFERDKSFVEGEDILAADFEAEYDNIADGMNAAALVDLVAASGNKTLDGLEETWKKANHLISGTEKTVEVARPTLAVVTAVFDFYLSLGSEDVTQTGTLAVDGTAQTREAIHRMDFNDAGFRDKRATVSQVYKVPLTTGSHTLALYAKSSSYSGTSEAKSAGTAYSYLLVPEP